VPTAEVTIPEQLRGVGASYRQLDHWVRCGYLQPWLTGPGSGYPRMWSVEELRVARLMSVLVDAGITPAKAAEAARQCVASAETGWAGPKRIVLSVNPRIVLEVEL